MNVYYFFVWVGGFIVSFAGGYIFLRLADTKRRTAGTAIVLRTTAVVAAMVLTYAMSFDGLNLGSILAVFAILGMIVFFRKRRP